MRDRYWLTRRPKPIDEQFWYYAPASEIGCWVWAGPKTRQGYGILNHGRYRYAAHRVAYELLIGPIPVGLELDHLCRVRACVNPAHLEPVTGAENIRRGALGDRERLETHCPQGHPYDESNTVVITHPRGRTSRRCRSCRNRAARVRSQLRAAVFKGECS